MIYESNETIIPEDELRTVLQLTIREPFIPKVVLHKQPKPTLVNCTPHPIHIIRDGNRIQTIPCSDHVARVQYEYKTIGIVEGVYIKEMTKIEVVDLPEPQIGVWYIVSSIVARSVLRKDLIIPVTVKDELGRIIGASSFISSVNFKKMISKKLKEHDENDED